MALWAISDLHLSLTSDKPMDVFGENWIDHEEKIKKNWIENIKKEDTVIIAGDISWSMYMEDGLSDLNWIHELPGRKILVRGNHDYWWQSITKLNSLYDDMYFIQNNFYTYGEYAICGTRLWNLPGTSGFTEHDMKIFNRECIRLRLSLDAAKKKGFSKIIAVVHFPPVYMEYNENDVIRIFKEYGVEKVIYGHLHGYALKHSFEQEVDNIEYINTSCDHLDFNPKYIL